MEQKIPNTEEVIRIERKGRFPFKQVVSDLLIDVISDSIVYAKRYIEITKFTTFSFGELQMHSVIIPALAKNTDCFILEYPIERKIGKENHFGRVDYYCRCNIKKKNEYHLFIELKSNKQSLPFSKYRIDSLTFWDDAYNQIHGIEREIKINKNFYNKPIICVCMETITLYAHETKDVSSLIDDAIKTANNDFGLSKAKPNLIVLWKCSNKITKIAEDEWHEGRKMYGIIFICHIMKPYFPKTL